MIIDINKNVFVCSKKKKKVFVGHANGLFEEENNVWILIYVCKSRCNFKMVH